MENSEEEVLKSKILSKNWKDRQEAYTRLCIHFKSDRYTNLIPLLQNETNIPALESSIDALMQGKPQMQDVRKILGNHIGNIKTSIKSRILSLCVHVVKEDRSILNELVCLLEHKNPKNVVGSLNALQLMVSEENTLGLLGEYLEKLFAHSDRNVRRETINLCVLLYKQCGDELMKYLENVKAVQMKELKEELDKSKVAEGELHTTPSKSTDGGVSPRKGDVSVSNQSKSATVANDKSIGGVNEEVTESAIISSCKNQKIGVRQVHTAVNSANDSYIKEQAALSHSSGCKLPAGMMGGRLCTKAKVVSFASAPLPSDIFNNLVSANWKLRLDSMTYLKAKLPALTSEIANVLLLRLSDSVVQIFLIALDCIIIYNLKSHDYIKVIIERFKEKKYPESIKNTLKSLGVKIDSVYGRYLRHKNPQVKIHLLEYIRDTLNIDKEVLLCVQLCLDDGNKDVRERAAEIIALAAEAFHCYDIFNEKARKIVDSATGRCDAVCELQPSNKESKQNMTGAQLAYNFNSQRTPGKQSSECIKRRPTLISNNKRNTEKVSVSGGVSSASSGKAPPAHVSFVLDLPSDSEVKLILASFYSRYPFFSDKAWALRLENLKASKSSFVQEDVRSLCIFFIYHKESVFHIHLEYISILKSMSISKQPLIMQYVMNKITESKLKAPLLELLELVNRRMVVDILSKHVVSLSGRKCCLLLELLQKYVLNEDEAQDVFEHEFSGAEERKLVSKIRDSVQANTRKAECDFLGSKSCANATNESVRARGSLLREVSSINEEDVVVNSKIASVTYGDFLQGDPAGSSACCSLGLSMDKHQGSSVSNHSSMQKDAATCNNYHAASAQEGDHDRHSTGLTYAAASSLLSATPSGQRLRCFASVGEIVDLETTTPKFTENFLAFVDTHAFYEIAEEIQVVDLVRFSPLIIDIYIKKNASSPYFNSLILTFISKDHILSDKEAACLVNYLVSQKMTEELSLIDRIYPVTKLFFLLQSIGAFDDIVRLIEKYRMFRGDRQRFMEEIKDKKGLDRVIGECVNFLSFGKQRQNKSADGCEDEEGGASSTLDDRYIEKSYAISKGLHNSNRITENKGSYDISSLSGNQDCSDVRAAEDHLCESMKPVKALHKQNIENKILGKTYSLEGVLIENKHPSEHEKVCTMDNLFVEKHSKSDVADRLVNGNSLCMPLSKQGASKPTADYPKDMSELPGNLAYSEDELSDIEDIIDTDLRSAGVRDGAKFNRQKVDSGVEGMKQKLGASRLNPPSIINLCPKLSKIVPTVFNDSFDVLDATVEASFSQLSISGLESMNDKSTGEEDRVRKVMTCNELYKNDCLGNEGTCGPPCNVKGDVNGGGFPFNQALDCASSTRFGNQISGMDPAPKCLNQMSNSARLKVKHHKPDFSSSFLFSPCKKKARPTSSLEHTLDHLIDHNMEVSELAFKNLRSLIDTDISAILFSANSIVSSISIQLADIQNSNFYALLIDVLKCLSLSKVFCEQLRKEVLMGIIGDLIGLLKKKVNGNERHSSSIVSDTSNSGTGVMTNTPGSKFGGSVKHIRCAATKSMSDYKALISDILINLCVNTVPSISLEVYLNLLVQQPEELLLKLLWRHSKNIDLHDRAEISQILMVLHEFYEANYAMILKKDSVTQKILQLHLKEIVKVYGNHIYEFNVEGLLKVFVENMLD